MICDSYALHHLTGGGHRRQEIDEEDTRPRREHYTLACAIPPPGASPDVTERRYRRGRAWDRRVIRQVVGCEAGPGSEYSSSRIAGNGAVKADGGLFGSESAIRHLRSVLLTWFRQLWVEMD